MPVWENKYSCKRGIFLNAASTKITMTQIA